MAYRVIAPEHYDGGLDARQTEQGIALIKEFFQRNLSTELRLRRVTAPLFVLEGLGVNDDLSGKEHPVTFPIRAMDNQRAEVVQSLAKWKRLTLAKQHVPHGFGIYTDMNAIRPDESELDNLHSIYVDQWDWELVIDESERTVTFLKEVVRRIYAALLRTEYLVSETFHEIKAFLPRKIHFIHAEELLQQYPDMTPKEREDVICKAYGAVFIIGIGGTLSNGKAHDGRAADYDDWSSMGENGLPGLNGDLLVWSPVLQQSVELSSMGVRVDAESLRRQLRLCGQEDRAQLFFHRELLEGRLPLSIGGGIGQSRLCMVLLHKAHIGEIQASIWPDEMRRECEEKGIRLI